MHFRIGTGSWADPQYKKLLVAPGVPAKERLKAYAAWFDHVEVNASYYRIPAAKLVATWIEQTPDHFTFDLRLHQFLSRAPKRAGTDGALIKRTLESARPLIEAKRLGCFLLVLPPAFAPENHQLDELDALVAALEPHAIAVELRHKDWVNGAQRAKTFAYFRARRLVWVSVDMPEIPGASLMPLTDEVTRSDIAYLRLHGRNSRYLEAHSAEEKHTYAYSQLEIAELATRALALARKAKRVHLIANNHAVDFAPRTALALQRVLRPDRHGPASS